MHCINYKVVIYILIISKDINQAKKNKAKARYVALANHIQTSILQLTILQRSHKLKFILSIQFNLQHCYYTAAIYSCAVSQNINVSQESNRTNLHMYSRF